MSLCQSLLSGADDLLFQTPLQKFFEILSATDKFLRLIREAD